MIRGVDRDSPATPRIQGAAVNGPSSAEDRRSRADRNVSCVAARPYTELVADRAGVDPAGSGASKTNDSEVFEGTLSRDEHGVSPCNRHVAAPSARSRDGIQLAAIDDLQTRCVQDDRSGGAGAAEITEGVAGEAAGLPKMRIAARYRDPLAGRDDQVAGPSFPECACLYEAAGLHLHDSRRNGRVVSRSIAARMVGQKGNRIDGKSIGRDAHGTASITIGGDEAGTGDMNVAAAFQGKIAGPRKKRLGRECGSVELEAVGRDAQVSGGAGHLRSKQLPG